MSDSPIIGVIHSSGELDEIRLWRLMFQGVVAAGGMPLALDCAAPHPQVANLV
jgi:putative glutamine amidotransferase